MTRDHRFDNAKFVAIYLVVLGHLIEPIITFHPAYKFIYMCIYTMHMPMFSLIAGYFSSDKFDRKSVIKLLRSIALPLVIFTLLYEGFVYARIGHLSGYSTELKPFWMLWFLLSLFVWRFLLPLFSKLPYYVLVSIGLSLVAGCFDKIGMTLNLSRTTYFFPFFLLGYYLSKHPAQTLNYLRIKKTYPIAILAICLGVVLVFNDLPEYWLFGNSSYGYLQFSTEKGMAIRFALYALSLSATLASLALISKQKSYFSIRGQASLAVYLWHGILVMLFTQFGYHYYTKDFPPALRIALIVVISLAFTIALSTPTIQKFTDRLLLAPKRKTHSNSKGA